MVPEIITGRPLMIVEELVDGEQRGLGIERIEMVSPSADQHRHRPALDRASV